MILYWAAFIATLGHWLPVDRGLDTPAPTLHEWELTEGSYLLVST